MNHQRHLHFLVFNVQIPAKLVLNLLVTALLAWLGQIDLITPKSMEPVHVIQDMWNHQQFVQSLTMSA